MPKISQFPNQVAADVADGDLIPIVDVGSPNTSERITVANLADAPQFTSRYAPLASDRIFLSPASFGIVAGTPSLGTLGNASASTRRTSAWLFDASTTERVATGFVFPTGWSTARAYLWWSNAGAGAGDVTWLMTSLALSDGESTDASGATLLSQVTARTAPAQYVVTRTEGDNTTITATAGEFVRLVVGREDGVADTLANDAGLLCVEIVRLT